MTTAAASAPALFPPIALHAARTGDAAAAPAIVLAVPISAGPRPRHHVYRGTRGLAFVFLGVAGLGVVALGALTSQIVGTYAANGALPSADRRVLELALRVAPFVMLLGFAQLLATWAVVRDRRHAMAAGLVFALGGALVGALGAAGIAAGAAPTLAASMSAGPSADLLGTFSWIIALDLLAALSIRRIVRGRATF